MGILDRFKQGPSLDREPELRDREMILAYLEDLARNRTQILLSGDEKELLPYQVTVGLLNDARGVFSLILRRPLTHEWSAKKELALTFGLDGQRFHAPVRYVGRGGYMQIEVTIPDRVRFADRRTRLRARFGAREKATVTALEGLFEGTGVSGKLVNISLEGVCLRIERALQVQGDRRLNITDGLYHRGQKLMLVRVLELPQIPTLECSGTVAHIEKEDQGVQVGIQLWGIGAQEAAYLEQVMTRRLPTFSRQFPTRHRHHNEGAEPGSHARKPLDEDLEAPDEAPEEAVEAAAPQAEPEPEAESAVEGEAKGRDRLLQWRRHSKHILVVVADDLDRAILAGTLQVGGFVNIHEARSLVQALDRCKKHLPDLLIVDHHVGPHSATDIVLKLRSLGTLEMSPVVILLDRPDVKLTLGAKALRLKHLLQKPVDYDGVLKDLLEHILDLR